MCITTEPLVSLIYFMTIENEYFICAYTYRISFFFNRCRDYGSIGDPPGYFNNHVWPGYLRDKKLAESLTNPTVCESQFLSLSLSLSACATVYVHVWLVNAYVLV